MRRSALVIASAVLVVAGCAVQGPQPERAEPETPKAKPHPKKPAYSLKRGGGYYQDDGPADNAPADLASVPDAEPRLEPLHRFANNPYNVLGRDYVPMREIKAYKARGVGSWYGRKFHGQRTSTGEIYDMFAMTAAHPTLPIPSYARVTNVANGRSVVVRVNDRGPFLHDRIIDLSYAAAHRLGYADAGSAWLDVELIVPGRDITLVAARGPEARAGAAPREEPVPDVIERILADQEEEAARPVPTLAEARGIFLQLAAFTTGENAESFRARIGPQLGGIADRLQVHAKDGMFRVQAGPYRDNQEASRAARKIRESLELKPVVIHR